MSYKAISFARLFRVLFILSIVASAGCSSEGAKKTSKDFRVEQDSRGKFWFAGSDGKQFLSIGVDNVVCQPWNPRPDTDYYAPLETIYGGDFQKWNDYAGKLLRDNGFNTFASWSDPRLHGEGMYSTICLYVIEHVKARCLVGLRPGFEDQVRQNTLKMLAKYDNLDDCIGLYLDNEMPWFGESGWDDIPTYTLLEVAFSMDTDDPARKRAKSFLVKKYKTPSAFSKAWGRELSSWDDLNETFLRVCLNEQTQKDRDEFSEIVAEAFFEPACRIVRQIAPGKLILGVRFSGPAPAGVIRSCGKHCDVISYNNYQASPEPDVDLMTKYWVWSGKKPLIITEYSWRGEDNSSGNPNTGGAGSVVKTQAQRGENYSKYVEAMLAFPMIIGAHWFEFADQSPQGRFDGENSNYGIVDIKNRPYKEVLKAMAGTNGKLEKIHRNSSIKAPVKIAQRPPVVFRAGQHPGRPPSVDLITEKPVRHPELFNADDASFTSERINGGIKLTYDTGVEWGCGALFFGPERMALKVGPKNATDLDGYSSLVIDAEIDKGLLFEIIVDEAGVDVAGALSYDVSAGDDGESFSFSGLLGTGKREEIKLNLEDLKHRLTWGNQKGFRKVDINAIKGIGVLLMSGQGKGEIKLYSLKLVR
jgi:hypothetical protein